MKRAFVQQKIILCALAFGVGGATLWGVQRAHSASPAANVAREAAALAANPPLKDGSATDHEISKWAAKARANDKDDTAWTNLGDSLMQKARETADLAYYGHAEKAYRKALEINSKNIGATAGMAWVNSGRHEFEQSIVWANKTLAIDPNNNDAYGLLGDADVERGNYDSAYNHYQKMLDLRPDTASYSRGAHLLHLTGDTRKAVWLMAKAVGTGAIYAENTAWCRTQLALILFSNGNVRAAEQTLKATLEKTPHNVNALAAMGKVQAAKKDYAAAIDYYKQALAIAPQHDSLVALGDLYRLTGNTAEAEKQYALVETIHQLQKSLGVRGDIQIAQFYADHDRKLPEALQLAQEEVKTRPNIAVYDTLAWCYYKNGRYGEAREAMLKALSQKTQEAPFFFHAGMIYDKLGERNLAQKYLYSALSLNGAFSPVFASVAANTLREIGSHQPARTQVAAQPNSDQNALSLHPANAAGTETR